MRLDPVLSRVMRAGLGALLVLTSLFAPVVAQAADARIGYIDSARIWIEFKDAAEAQQRFERQVQGWRDEAAEKQKAVDALKAEVKDQAPVLSALKRQEKETALTRAISDYESFVTDIWGTNGRAAQENSRSTEEIIAVVRRAVEKVAGQRGLELVLDVTSGFVIYADKSLDMTNEVLAELNSATGSAR
ncbi:MAG: OmpH family outer membrane protein [Candidatus Eisenbacteria bacterium]|nr:OmpH family outer membrane protein [Candidatus Eisenbacteria bacterium]